MGACRENFKVTHGRPIGAFLPIVDRLAAVIRVFHEINEDNPDRAVDARDLLAQIDVKFIVLLPVIRKILCDTKALSYMLQSPTIDLSRAIDVVNTVR